MNDPLNDYGELDEALAALPRDAEPSRDLWPEIRATIQSDARQAKTNGEKSTRRFGFLNGWTQLAAGVVLMIATATTTYVITRQTVSRELIEKGLIAANFDAKALGSDYLRARNDLENLYKERIAQLPADTRARLEGNLADLRRAADEIAMTLAQHPSDPLLNELLVSTRRRELQLLADVGRMAIPNS